MEKNASAHDSSYWFRWQVPVCALVFLVPALVSVNLINKKSKNNQGAVDDNSLKSITHLWVPRWRFLHPRWLLFYRALAFLTMAFLLYQTLLVLGLFGFLFYTQWTFALVAVYFALATIVSVHGCCIYSAKSLEHSGDDDKLLKTNSQEGNDEHVTISKEKQNRVFIRYRGFEQQAWFCGNIMERIYQACAGAVMLTDMVFWCLLVPFMLGEEFQLTMLIVFTHSVNAVFLILDTLLNSLPFPWFGMVYFVLWSSCYVVFQWALHLCCFTWWPYPFLDLSNPWAPMWYLALALVHVACYGLYMLLVRGKDFICSRMFGNSYLRISADKKQA